MSVFIGAVKAPDHNSPNDAAEVWCSPDAVEICLLNSVEDEAGVMMRGFDPIAARNLAALLVRASEEAERMAARREHEIEQARTPIEGRLAFVARHGDSPMEK
jgi:hypothetical protein